MTSVLAQLVRVWRMNTRRQLQAEGNAALGRIRTNGGIAELFCWQALLAMSISVGWPQKHICGTPSSRRAFPVFEFMDAAKRVW